VRDMRIVKGRPSRIPLRTYQVDGSQGTVTVSILREGDERTYPQKSCEAHLVGRLLQSGCVFESSRAKGKPPMRMLLGGGSIIPGMELALPTLSLGSYALLEIPASMGYGSRGVPRMVPPDADLLFEVELTMVDSTSAAAAGDDVLVPAPLETVAPGEIFHPHWLARQELLDAPSYYVNYCRHLARAAAVDDLPRAKQIPRKCREDALLWKVDAAPAILCGVQDDWKARSTWDLDWFQRELGHHRQLLKWIGPVFTQKENLWTQPVYEASVSDYIDYIRSLEAVDPNCEEDNAAACPRLYLNGWPCFSQLPHLQDYITNPTFFGDSTRDLFREHEELRESFLASLAKSPTPQTQRDKALAEEYWEMTKLFISPKGSITRLHFDNGGAHAWLSQVRGRKLFVCYHPDDGQFLHPFPGDEGLLSGSWVDPLDPEAEQKWPDYSKATPYVSILEEGETLVAPKGWWHYAVALDTSITVMRNFYSEVNKSEYLARKDKTLEEALVNSLLRPRSKGKSDEELRQGARMMIAKVRDVLASQRR